jgi:hypothetical protein
MFQNFLNFPPDRPEAYPDFFPNFPPDVDQAFDIKFTGPADCHKKAHRAKPKAMLPVTKS